MKLSQLIQLGETDQQDFKETISSSQKIAKTMVSFANTRGGRILVGVRDNGGIRGANIEEEKYMLEAAAGFFCKPPIQIVFKTLEEKGKQVLLVEVPNSSEKPHFALGDDNKWWAYIRVDDNSVLASKTVLDVIRRETSGADTLIKYTSKEEALLGFLSKTNKITLKEFCKLVNISKWRANKILVNLISAGIIRVHNTEKTEFYTLS